MTGDAGNGGALTVSVLKNRGELGTATIHGGAGGAADGAGSGGRGGEVNGFLFKNNGSVGSSFLIEGGAGGANTDTGASGAGGTVRSITVNNSGTLGADVRLGVFGGDGGEAGTGRGGFGGDARDISLKDRTGTGELAVFGGDGGGGVVGGDGGNIVGVTLSGVLSDFSIGGNNGGRGGDGVTAGGEGGAIRNVTGTAGLLTVISGRGGSASGGSGGGGGRISAVDVAVTYYAQQIRSGSGGDAGDSAAGDDGSGGDGGAISDVRIRGDIGNFTQPFGVNEPRMGGLITGLGGEGTTAGATGTINGVKAARIAAIFAGDSSTAANALTTANAVRAISNVQAKAIGADLDGDGVFDFTDANGNGTYNLGTADTAIDGLVLALLAGYNAATVSPVPFKPVLI